MNKKEIMAAVEAAIDKSVAAGNNFGTPMMRYDKKWRYPQMGDDQRTCPMLDFMFRTEYRSGLLIFIPDMENKYGQPGNIQRNSEEG